MLTIIFKKRLCCLCLNNHRFASDRCIRCDQSDWSMFTHESLRKISKCALLCRWGPVSLKSSTVVHWNSTVPWHGFSQRLEVSYQLLSTFTVINRVPCLRSCWLADMVYTPINCYRTLPLWGFQLFRRVLHIYTSNLQNASQKNHHIKGSFLITAKNHQKGGF